MKKGKSERGKKGDERRRRGEQEVKHPLNTLN